MKSPASGLPKKTGFRSIAATASRAMEWFKALLAHEKPLEGLVQLAYMLKGGSHASNDAPFASEPPTGKKWVQTGPLVTIGGPGIVKMLDSYPASADDTRKPYVMFGGTPYEHLMVPVRQNSLKLDDE